VIRNNLKLAFFIHISFANNANEHIRRICTRRLIFVSTGVNSLAIFLTKRTGITTSLAALFLVTYRVNYNDCMLRFTMRDKLPTVIN